MKIILYLCTKDKNEKHEEDIYIILCGVGCVMW